MWGDTSTSEAFSEVGLSRPSPIWIMLCIAKHAHMLVFILVGACVIILSLPTHLLGGTVLPDPFYFHPAKPSILDNMVMHREDWSEQRGQVLLRIPSVWAVSLGSIKAASCLRSATKHCKKSLQNLAGTLINFEITCILSVLLILVQSDHISLVFLGKQFKN